MRRFITSLGLLTASWFLFTGCTDSTCELIVDERLECDTTGAGGPLRELSISLCEESAASTDALQQCADCLEAAPDCLTKEGCPCEL